jgi:ATP-dependent helicase/nuclease subunit A
MTAVAALPALTVIPAGAGSGKTYTIQTTLADWVVSGRVAPERIVAVTFTEVAAVELRERIRFELVKRGMIAEALRLDRAYISTIHALGLRLLTEFAFEEGISPAPRLLDEAESAILIRRALARTDKADAVMGNLKAFGYKYDPVTDRGPEDNFRDTILSLMDRLRSLGRRGEEPALVARAVGRIGEVYAPAEDAKALNRALHGAVGKLLARFPDDLSGRFAGNKSASEHFRRNYRDLRRAANPAEIEGDWGLWCSLRDLRLAKRGAPTPEGYDDLALAVMETAASLCRHPGPLKDAQAHAKGLLEGSQDSLGRYKTAKREGGLVDYADMLADAFGLLASRKEVLGSFLTRVDCLVIDEFQDTNPLQFSLLWTLRKAGVPTFVVGDLKQAIMGFQNADPRLFEQLLVQHPKDASPLTGNWRSAPALMRWINRVGEGLFGGRYIALKAKASYPSRVEVPVEIIEAPEFIRSNAIRAAHTALRIQALLNDETQHIWDRRKKETRRLRGGDVAVLCYTHALVQDYSDALRALGVRTRIEQGGWFASPIVRIAFHALSYVADRNDRHAALFLAVTELGRHDLESALKVLLAGGELDDPILKALDRVREGERDRTVSCLVADVINALDLYGTVSEWPDAAQARANLLRLQGEARAFREANRQVLSSGGYHGGGLKTFLSWLAARADDEEDIQPDPGVADEDAVQVLTWHKSKGLEWPVVAVCCMHREVKARLPDFSVSYEDFSDLGAVLNKARIDVSLDFAAEESAEAFRAPLQERDEEEARRLLYVVLTRAREKVILEWPSYLEGKDGVTYWSLLKDLTGMRPAGGKVVVGKEEFPCRVSVAGKEMPPECGGAGGVAAPLPVVGRRAVRALPLPEGLTPEAVTPSSLHGGPVEVDRPVTVASYGGPLKLDLDVFGAEKGLLLHRCFEVLDGRGAASDGREAGPDGGGPADAGSGAVPDLLDLAAGVTLSAGDRKAIARAAQAFNGWLKTNFSPVAVHREMPVLGLDARGSVVSGCIDVLVETETGFWILDHKSDAADGLEEGFRYYLPQLLCYAEVVAKARPDKPVLGVAVHWIMRGCVTTMAVEASVAR